MYIWVCICVQPYIIQDAVMALQDEILLQRYLKRLKSFWNSIRLFFFKLYFRLHVVHTLLSDVATERQKEGQTIQRHREGRNQRERQKDEENGERERGRGEENLEKERRGRLERNRITCVLPSIYKITIISPRKADPKWPVLSFNSRFSTAWWGAGTVVGEYRPVMVKWMRATPHLKKKKKDHW